MASAISTTPEENNPDENVINTQSPVYEVQRILGHNTLSETSHYFLDWGPPQ